MEKALDSRSSSDLIVSRLWSMGVRVVFGVPGGAVEPLYDALARASRAGHIRLITARHEAGAAFMAYGWWLETGLPAAVVTTTGPGAINALAGVACASAEYAPMFVLTAQVASPKHGRHALQECSSTSETDTVAMYAACTKLSAMVTHPDQIEAMLARAYVRAHQGVPGPVHLSFPTEVLRSPAPPATRAPDYASMVRRAVVDADPKLLALVAGQCDIASRPVVLLGDLSRPAVPAAIALAEKIGAPICASPKVSDLVSGHSLFHGCFGFAGHATASTAVTQADLVLLVDASGGEFEASAWGNHVPNVVHLSDCAEYLSRTPEGLYHVLGDTTRSLERMTALISARPTNVSTVAWRPEVTLTQGQGVIAPQALMRVLAERLPHDTSVYIDCGNAFSWAIHYLHGDRPHGQLHLSLNYAAMGWSVGACIGAALAAKRPVVMLVGDGALLMAGQEFSVAVQERLSPVFIVLNDSSLGMVHHGQRLSGAERVATDLPKTNFAAMARAMGGDGIEVSSLEHLQAIDFAALCRRDVPTLIDVSIDISEVPPMGDRIRGLATK